MLPRPQRSFAHCLVVLSVQIGVSLLASPIWAAQAVPPPSSAEIEAKRAGLASEFAQLRAELEQAAASSNAAAEDARLQQFLAHQVELLQRLDWLYRRQIDTLHVAAERRAEMAGEMATLKETAPPRPEQGGALRWLDERRDQLDAARAEAELREAGLRTTRDALTQAEERLTAAEAARRAAKEASDEVASPQRSALARELRARELESRVAAAERELLALQLQSDQAARDEQRRRVAALSEGVDSLAQQTHFSPQELNEIELDLEQREFGMSRAIEAARAERAAAQGGESSAAQGSEEMAIARLLADETAALEVASLERQAERLPREKELWTRRYQVAAGLAAAADLAAWRADAEAEIEQADGRERVQRLQAEELRRRVQRLREVAAEAGPSSPGAETRLRRVDRQVGIAETDLAETERYRRLNQRLLTEIGEHQAGLSVGERFAAARQMLDIAWHYEIGSVDDRPITVGKIAIGILLLIAAVLVSRLVSHLLGMRVLPRLGLDPGAAAALQSVSFYVLVSVLALFALHVINIPLTIFTFVGGALAIGVGFGSQNIVNNFISGLILLAERPDPRWRSDRPSTASTGNVERVGPAQHAG